MSNHGIWGCFTEWTIIGLLLSLYFATIYVLPAAGGMDPEPAGWRVSPEYNFMVLRLAFTIGLLMITVGLLGYRFLPGSGYLSMWSVGIAGSLLGVLNRFLHELQPAIPYSGLVLALGVIAVPSGWLAAYWLAVGSRAKAS